MYRDTATGRAGRGAQVKVRWALGRWGFGALGRWGAGALGRWVARARRSAGTGRHGCVGPQHGGCWASGLCAPRCAAGPAGCVLGAPSLFFD